MGVLYCRYLNITNDKDSNMIEKFNFLLGNWDMESVKIT